MIRNEVIDTKSNQFQVLSRIRSVSLLGVKPPRSGDSDGSYSSSLFTRWRFIENRFRASTTTYLVPHVGTAFSDVFQQNMVIK